MCPELELNLELELFMAGPRDWNSLPLSVRGSSEVNTSNQIAFPLWSAFL